MADIGITGPPAVVARRGPLLRHPAPVGIAAAAVSASVLAVFPLGAGAVIGALLGAVLVVVAAVDIERRIIPNRIVLPATAIVLLLRLAFFPQHTPEWLLGALIGGLVIFLPRLLNPASFGMGDVKLAMLIGAGLGWGVVLALPVAFACTFPAAVFVLLRGGLGARKKTIPFGPFLALGALIVMFFPYVTGLATG